MKAYWFFGDVLRGGRPIPADGVKLTVNPRRIKLCYYGLHASLDPFDALQYAPGPNLALVEVGGCYIKGKDKLVASERAIIRRIDATQLLQDFAKECARSVLYLWDAPQVVVDYLWSPDIKLADVAGYTAYAGAARATGAAAPAARAAAYAAYAALATCAAAYAALAATCAATCAAARERFNIRVFRAFGGWAQS